MDRFEGRHTIADLIADEGQQIKAASGEGTANIAVPTWAGMGESFSVAVG